MSKAWRTMKSIGAAALAHHKLGLRVRNASEYETEPMVLHDKVHPWLFKVVRLKTKEFLEVEKLTYIMQQHKDVFSKKDTTLAESLEELEDFIEAVEASKEWPAKNRTAIKADLISWWAAQLNICDARLKEDMAKAETQAMKDMAKLKAALEDKILMVENLKAEKDELRKKKETETTELKRKAKRGIALRLEEPEILTPPVGTNVASAEARKEASIASAFSVASTTDLADGLSAKEKQWERKLEKQKKAADDSKAKLEDLLNKMAEERVSGAEKQQRHEAELEALRSEIIFLKNKPKAK
jgi:hypothetical protein